MLCFTKATSPAPSARHLCRRSCEPGRGMTPATAAPSRLTLLRPSIPPIFYPGGLSSAVAGDPRGSILQFCSSWACSQMVGCVALPGCRLILAIVCPVGQEGRQGGASLRIWGLLQSVQVPCCLPWPPSAIQSPDNPRYFEEGSDTGDWTRRLLMPYPNIPS